MMIKIGGVSLYAFRVAIRWCAIKGYPNSLKEWTKDQNEMLQQLADEVDSRMEARYDKKHGI